jgi:hypothetical protein
MAFVGVSFLHPLFHCKNAAVLPVIDDALVGGSILTQKDTRWVNKGPFGLGDIPKWLEAATRKLVATRLVCWLGGVAVSIFTGIFAEMLVGLVQQNRSNVLSHFWLPR